MSNVRLLQLLGFQHRHIRAHTLTGTRVLCGHQDGASWTGSRVPPRTLPVGRARGGEGMSQYLVPEGQVPERLAHAAPQDDHLAVAAPARPEGRALHCAVTGVLVHRQTWGRESSQGQGGHHHTAVLASHCSSTSPPGSLS